MLKKILYSMSSVASAKSATATTPAKVALITGGHIYSVFLDDFADCDFSGTTLFIGFLTTSANELPSFFVLVSFLFILFICYELTRYNWPGRLLSG